MLGDGPTPGHQFVPEYDDEEEEYYYDETEQTYDDDDAGNDAGEDNYTDGNIAPALTDTGQGLCFIRVISSSAQLWS